MTKIVGTNGRILNTDYYEFAVTLHGDESEVVAMCALHPDSGSVMFSGTERKCRAYLRKLAVLNGAYEYKDGGFHQVKSGSDDG